MCKHQRYTVDAKEQTGYCHDCKAEGRMVFVVGEELEILRTLASEVIALHDSGYLPDGDSTDVQTMLWAEEWARKLRPNDQAKGPATAARSADGDGPA